MSLFEAHLGRIHSFVKEGSDAAVSMAASGVSVTASVLLLSPQLALIQLLVIPALAIASRELLGPLRQRLGVAQRESDRVSAMLHGNISNMPTIHAFATQDLEAARLAASGEAARRAQQDADLVASAYVPVVKAIVGSGFMATLVQGGLLARAGSLAPGAYNAVAMSQLRLLVAVGHFGGSLENYQKTRLALKSVFGVLDMVPHITTRPDAVPFRDVTRAIVLDNVVFAYEEDRVIVRGLRMRFPAKQTVGIVGSSGAGKTTVLKLLERFYDVQGGAVRYDDVDVRDLKIEDLRRSIAMVPQEVSLFAATVRDNIAYAKPEASDDEVRHAAEVAEAHEFISALPDGYHTRVGHGGISLSAGQRQRLAIARVVLADRPILLFDEATSALDYKTEAAIQRSLVEVTEGRTTIIVAHRLATIRRADLIYVLDDGRVKEQGVHDDLVRQDGIYAAMWRVQTGEVTEPAGTNDATTTPLTRRAAKPKPKATRK